MNEDVRCDLNAFGGFSDTPVHQRIRSLKAHLLRVDVRRRVCANFTHLLTFFIALCIAGSSLTATAETQLTDTVEFDKVGSAYRGLINR
jgi:hypothetical protein